MQHNSRYAADRELVEVETEGIFHCGRVDVHGESMEALIGGGEGDEHPKCRQKEPQNFVLELHEVPHGVGGAWTAKRFD